MSEGKTVKIGIIGTGKIAGVHAEYYKRIPWVEMVGVADVVPGRAEEFAKKWGVPAANAFLDYHKLLEKVEMDGVSVCTYNQAHREPTIACLEAGKNVLLEKPMAATLTDAQAIMRAGDKSGKILMVGFQPDFGSEHKAAKLIITEGTLGHIYYAETVASRRWGIPGGTFMKQATAGAGSLVDIGVYALHAALWLMGDPKPVSVSATTADFLGKAFKGTAYGGWAGPWKAADMEVEEFASAFIRFENGAVLVFKTSWAANADSMGKTFFMGTKGGLQLDPLELYINQQIGDLNMTATPKGMPPNDFDAQWLGKCTAFAEAVRDGKSSPIDPKGVYLVNVVMDGILRSAKQGHEVKVTIDY